MPQSEMPNLTTIRRQIDTLDQQLLTLFNQRAQLAQQVAEAKQADSPQSSGAIQYYRQEREAQILRQIQAHNPGPIPNDDIARLFREIMSICLSLEQPLTIGYLGPEGTFSHAAAMKQFGGSVNLHAESTIEGVFQSVEKGLVDFGIVPIENSTEGVVNATQDALVRTTLKVSGEVTLKIEHHLLSNAKGLEDIETVAAHPQALRQCRQWLATNVPWAVQKEMDSNAAGAALAEHDDTLACVASEQASVIFNLSKLASNIEDQVDNTTRFWVIGRAEVPESGEDKTALYFSVKNRPGALVDILHSFASRSISMTRITSRPSPFTQWDYVFFVDIEGHIADENIQAALKELEPNTTHLIHLGSYPVSPLD